MEEARVEVEELDTGDTVDEYRTALTALPAPATGSAPPTSFGYILLDIQSYCTVYFTYTSLRAQSLFRPICLLHHFRYPNLRHSLEPRGPLGAFLAPSQAFFSSIAVLATSRNLTARLAWTTRRASEFEILFIEYGPHWSTKSSKELQWQKWGVQST